MTTKRHTDAIPSQQSRKKFTENATSINTLPDFTTLNNTINSVSADIALGSGGLLESTLSTTRSSDRDRGIDCLERKYTTSPGLSSLLSMRGALRAIQGGQTGPLYHDTQDASDEILSNDGKNCLQNTLRTAMASIKSIPSSDPNTTNSSQGNIWNLIIDHLGKESLIRIHSPAPIIGLQNTMSEEIPGLDKDEIKFFGSECRRILATLQSELKTSGIANNNNTVISLPSDSHIDPITNSPKIVGLETLMNSKGLQGAATRNTTGAFLSVSGSTSQHDKLSTLSRLLYPHGKTREGIDTLLRQLSPVHVQDSETTEWVFRMVREPMWSPEPYRDVSHTLAINPVSRKLRAATINELVEMMTPIHITPHQSVPQESFADLDEFCNDMYLCYQHCITPYGLLAKLLQRFFVPSYIPFHEHYNRRGIFIQVRDTSSLPTLPLSMNYLGGSRVHVTSTTSLWITVMKKIQIRVAAVIAEWSRKHPSHFDTIMRDVVTTWLWECCSGPVLWSDSPSELYCCAEAIRANLLVCSNQEGEGKFIGTYKDNNIPPTLLDNSQYQSTVGANKSIKNTLFAKFKTEHVGLSFPTQVSKTGRWSTAAHDKRAKGRLLTKNDKINRSDNNFIGVNNNATTSPMKIDIPKENYNSVQDFLTMNTKTVAVLMSAIDMQALRTVSTSDLFQLATTDVALSDLKMGNVETHVLTGAGMGLRVMMIRFECTTHWLLNILMDAVELDVHLMNYDSKEWKWSLEVLYHVTTFAYRLLALNNFHSTFAVLAALTHPMFLKVYDSVLNASVPLPLKNNIQKLTVLFDFSDGVGVNLRKYIDALPDNSMYPAIPVLQQWATELRIVENTQPTILMDAKLLPTIHWRKMKVITGIYRQLIDSQDVTDPPEYNIDVTSEGTLLWLQRALGGPFRTSDELVMLDVYVMESKKL